MAGGAPVAQTSGSAGIYIFDAYGDVNGAANARVISPLNGEEAIQLSVQKPGYTSRTVFHRPLYETITSNGKTYWISHVATVYLCAVGSLDTDGDSLCDAAEDRYSTNPNSTDTDGDNISDAVELFGSQGVDLRYFGADPRKKDLFIEADYYPGLAPGSAAIDTVVASFCRCAVSNPDGTTGIALHINLNQQIDPADADSDLNPVWTDFDVIKNKYFPARRAQFFHYVVFANQYDGGSSSGISRGIPGHDFVVTLGNWSTPGGTVQQQAGTLMHEFGHNLGLRHGGGENENYKPNYLSIMSYNYQLNGLTFDGVGGRMDYSRLLIAGLANPVSMKPLHLRHWQERPKQIWPTTACASVAGCSPVMPAATLISTRMASLKRWWRPASIVTPMLPMCLRPRKMTGITWCIMAQAPLVTTCWATRNNCSPVITRSHPFLWSSHA